MPIDPNTNGTVITTAKFVVCGETGASVVGASVGAFVGA
jgi:hypothetical protein